MTISRLSLLATLAGFSLLGESRTPVVIELFTSEGCSSCPPADLLLDELSHRNPAGVEVIALSEHVDYWNHLGWRDPFSSAQFSDRQHAYTAVFAADSVYTPQMVVDGLMQFNGSDSDQARKAIQYAAEQPKAVVAIERKGGDGRVSVRVERLAAARSDRADVFVAVTESRLSSQVARGENQGRTLKHTGVVRSLMKVVEIDAKKGTYVADLKLPVHAALHRENARAVIFVQDRKTRRIVGAASCEL